MVLTVQKQRREQKTTTLCNCATRFCQPAHVLECLLFDFFGCEMGFGGGLAGGRIHGRKRVWEEIGMVDGFCLVEKMDEFSFFYSFLFRARARSFEGDTRGLCWC
jgi:hypothetical protein